VKRKTAPAPGLPAEAGKVTESITDVLGATLCGAGSGVRALVEPKVALASVAVAARLP
jgi:hypothetical protein